MAYLKQDVIWVDFWNQNGTSYVPKLSTFALRKGMMTLEKTIVDGDKTRPLLDWFSYEKLKVFTEDEDLAPKLIDYYKPFREVLARTNLITDYHMLIRAGSNYGIIPGDVENFDWFDSEYDSLLSLVFWLCFENIESRKVFLQFNIELEGRKDVCDLVFEHIVRSKENMLQCRTLEVMFEKPCPRPTIEDISNFFERFSRLEVLDIEARDLRNDMSLWTINEKNQILKMISKLNNLKTLKIHLDEKEVPGFCQFVEMSPKTLEVIMIKFRTKAKIEEVGTQANDMLRVMKKLIKLKMVVLELEPKFQMSPNYNCNLVPEELGEEYLGWCDYGPPDKWLELINSYESIEDPIDFVKTITIFSYNSMCLKLIDKHFKSVENLTLKLNGHSDGHLHRLIQEESLNQFENLKTVRNFKIEVLNKNDNPIGISTIMKLFPNLLELHTNFIEVNTEHLSDVTIFKNLEKLVLLNDAINPLSLIYKMPNLKQVILIKKKWSSQIDKATLKNFLPQNCALVEEDEDKMGCYRFITTTDREPKAHSFSDYRL